MNQPIREAELFASDFRSRFTWYLGEGGEILADRFKNAVKQTIARIGREPTLGRKRHFRNPLLSGLRSLPVDAPFDRNLIFYRVTEKETEIWRLMHGARHLPRRLAEHND